ncbi:hypothetical protein SAMN02745857_03610 [Andreprevotia lacus DSM 23236]|jgi:hypothetical protein|uniref:Leucine Rich repeat-containing protein n=1 Tax=Andreprevotia lacus DSM 23236 TaxID=1121001 RepID=A0A1W1XZZ3_9NEIS|nr:leucine-rich repeat domain-containing protein [Andreprevotia lacus]SMC29111.1 hypothetical protein SAMN02745857_03610 [Andreprevotia lacus DSM 23236]
MTSPLAHPNPFHRANWPRAILHPDDYDGSDRLVLEWDFGANSDQERKAVIKTWCARLPGLTQLRWLSVWSRTAPPLFEALCELPQLECLQIKYSTVQQLGPISRLQRLRYLDIGTSGKVEAIAPLATLAQLRHLKLTEFKQIRDYTPLAELSELESLWLACEMYSADAPGSLQAFTRLEKLRELLLDVSHVDSLLPLAALPQLAELTLNNIRPMADYAELAALLPKVQCRWLHPYWRYVDWGNGELGLCKRCQQKTMVMLTGKGSGRDLCSHCQADKLAQHVAKFDAVVAATQARQGVGESTPQ